MLKITVKKPDFTELFYFRTFEEFLEWWPREKKIWPEAVILDIEKIDD